MVCRGVELPGTPIHWLQKVCFIFCNAKYLFYAKAYALLWRLIMAIVDGDDTIRQISQSRIVHNEFYLQTCLTPQIQTWISKHGYPCMDIHTWRNIYTWIYHWTRHDTMRHDKTQYNMPAPLECRKSLRMPCTEAGNYPGVTPTMAEPMTTARNYFECVAWALRANVRSA